MNAVILSGGKGTRLWPLSSEDKPKQFMPFLNNISMLQRTYQFLKKASCDISITSIIGYKDLIDEQINDYYYIEEPESLNTFPAISLSILNLYYQKNIKDNIFIIPVDSYTESSFYSNLKILNNLMVKNQTSLGIIGIKALTPSTNYGYILSHNNLVEKFIEKPTKNKAISLIKKGALYNSGIVCINPLYLVNYFKEHYQINNYEDFLSFYSNLPKISFDYEILEKEKRITCLEAKEEWFDIGIYSNFLKVASKVDLENNVSIINYSNIPIESIGNKNLLIAASKNGILIANKKKLSNTMTPSIVNNKVLKPWGYYEVINKTNNSLTKVMNIFASKSIHYQFHNHRDEFWTILEGKGVLLLNGKTYDLIVGDSVKIPLKAKHKVTANTNLKILETQIGDYISEDDIERLTNEKDN